MATDLERKTLRSFGALAASLPSVLVSAFCASAALVVSACSGGGSGTDTVVTIVQDASVLPPRAQQALDHDPLGLFTGVPMDQRMNVGLRVALSLSAPGATTITDVQWSVPATAIAGYELEAAVDRGQGYLTSCATTALARADLRQQDIAFYFTRVGDEVISVSAVVDGVRKAATKTFVVRRHPKAEIFYVVGPGFANTLPDLTGDGRVDDDDFLLYQATFGHDADPSGTKGFGNLGEHNAWHQLIPSQTMGDEFFRFHRGYGQKADCWRGIFGYPCTQVYATAPGYVPTGRDVDHTGVGAGGICDHGTGVGDGNGVVALSRDTTGHAYIEELPAQLTLAGDGSVALGDFATGHDLVLAVIDYHDRQHGHLSMTGDLLDNCTSPADPLYWRFHLMLTRLYELWQFLKLDDGTAALDSVECTGPGGARVFFPDPDVRLDAGCPSPVVYACNPPSGSVFPLGTTEVTCTISDAMLLASGSTEPQPRTTQCTFDVTVVDTLPPTLVMAPEPTVLRKPDHGYESVRVEDFVLGVFDLCEGEMGSEAVTIVMVTSDEAQNALGSGNTTDDIVIAPDCRSVALRRERAGPGNGRVYNIVVSVSDGAGKSATATHQVMVPHDQNKTAVDDGAAYSVGCSMRASRPRKAR